MIERKIKYTIEPQMVIEGAGVRLLRSIAPQVSNLFDPFLLFDHFAFNDPNETPLAGFPTHPHRGIETVTYMLAGQVRHRDSLGNQGVIDAGDVQWMTAGRGILHEEMPRRSEQNTIFGFQLWVNLPAAEKMSEPRYQEVKEEQIPIVEHPGIKVRVVAGEYDGTVGPVHEIAAKPLYMDITLAADTSFTHTLPKGHTVLLYIFEGNGMAGGDKLDSPMMIQYEDGDYIDLRSGADGMRFMLMAGAPFKEPIVPYGPFVMNTREEIRQTLDELKNGTFIR